MKKEKKWRADAEARACYVLVFQVGSVEYFYDLNDLCVRVAKLARKSVMRWAAYGRDGFRLGQARLVALGEKRIETLGGVWGRRNRWAFGSNPGYERRSLPVKGTACRRGGGGCHRHFATIGSKRKAQAIRGEGEPLPRGAQSVSSIPDPWDDYMRGGQKCWKKQRRGAKAWDRGPYGFSGCDRMKFIDFLMGNVE